MKKQTVVALLLLLLIPVLTVLGGFLFGLINPEIAAGHPDYARNFHFLTLVKIGVALGSAVVAGILWLFICFLLIRSKERSRWWLFFAVLGPFGFAILAMLNDKAPAETDRHARFVISLTTFVRAGYELCSFVIIWLLAYQGMVLMRELIILYQSVTTGMSTVQIIDLQNASSGMWAFGEMTEVMYLVILLYLIRPIVFNFVGSIAATIASPKAH